MSNFNSACVISSNSINQLSWGTIVMGLDGVDSVSVDPEWIDEVVPHLALLQGLLEGWNEEAGGYAFCWEDPLLPGTNLTVTEDGLVTYKYRWSIDSFGARDVGAVRRAVSAWKKWVKPPNLKLHCYPVRKELGRFYRLFPEVEQRGEKAYLS